MKPATGTTPLSALHAIAIDTETTGLDTARARIVQFGAVPIDQGCPVPARIWQILVDPGEPVPATATAIHGITDADLAGRARFSQALAELERLAAGRVLVGYAIGFDLAVTEHEANRAGIVWARPRSLCVRLLATIVAPDLPDQSLDTIAAWLGLTIENRHSAGGDALAARGVRTLGEAERAVLGLTAQLESGHQAGWAEPVLRPGAAAGALGGVDPYAYRHRVRELMSSPPAIVRSSTRVSAAMDLMVARRIGSVFVSDHGQPERPMADFGIVTERDLIRRLVEKGEQALRQEIGSIASRPWSRYAPTPSSIALSAASSAPATSCGCARGPPSRSTTK